MSMPNVLWLTTGLAEAHLGNMPLVAITGQGGLHRFHKENFQFIDVVNSLTSVEDFLNAAEKLIEKRTTGVFNIVNDGTIEHREIMALYKKFVDPAHSYSLIKPEELLQKGLVKTGRSNCKLDNSKLIAEGIKMRDVNEAIKSALMGYKKFV